MASIRTMRSFLGVLALLLAAGIGLRAIHREHPGRRRRPQRGRHRQRQDRAAQPRHPGLRDHDRGRLGQLPVPEPRARLVQDHGRSAGVQARRADRDAADQPDAEPPDHARGRRARGDRDRQRRDPARQRRGDPQPADARDRVVVRPADAGPQLHRARDAGAGRVRARHDGRRTAGRRRHAGIGRRQLLDRNGRRRQRQRPGHGRQQVHHRRAQRDERHPSGRAEPDAEPRRDPGDEHPGQHLHVRVRRRQLDPDDQHDQVGIGAVPRRWSATTTTTTACSRRPCSWGRTTNTIRSTPTTSRRRSAARSCRRSRSSSSSRSSRCARRRRRGTRRCSSPTRSSRPGPGRSTRTRSARRS